MRKGTAVGGWIPAGAGTSFQVGDRSEETFLKLYEGLPEAKLYRSAITRCMNGYPEIAAGRERVRR